MTFRNLLWRLAGLFAIAGSASAAFASGQLNQDAPAGPAPVGELALALLSFLLASYGILLLIYGERLHNHFAGDLARKNAAKKADGASADVRQETDRLASWIAADPFALAGGRAAIALFLAQRTLAAQSDKLPRQP